jgi:hypothetical protein
MLVPRNLSVIESHADNESSRYALGAVHLERDNKNIAHAVATDGRRLIEISFPADQDCPAFAIDPVPGFETRLPLGALAAADKAAKLTPSVASKMPALAYIGLSESSDPEQPITIEAANATSTMRSEVKPVVGRFPRWRDVFPAHGAATSTVILDPRFLIDACKALGTLCTSESRRGVLLAINGPDRAIGLYARNNETGVAGRAVIMPLASDDPQGIGLTTGDAAFYGITLGYDHVQRSREAKEIVDAVARAIDMETAAARDDAHEAMDAIITAGAKRRQEYLAKMAAAFEADEQARQLADEAAAVMAEVNAFTESELAAQASEAPAQELPAHAAPELEEIAF